MSYWCVAQLQPNRTALALGCLALAGYATYLPKIIERRRNHGKRVERTAPLFPGYAFVLIELQWHAANVAPGVHHILRTGLSPTRVPDEVIADIRKRQRNGLVQLPKRSLKPGAPVRILAGPFRDHPAIFADMSGPERVAVLLHVLGAHQRVTLPAADVEPAG